MIQCCMIFSLTKHQQTEPNFASKLNVFQKWFPQEVLIMGEPLVYCIKIGVRSLQLWILSRVRPPN